MFANLYVHSVLGSRGFGIGVKYKVGRSIVIEFAAPLSTFANLYMSGDVSLTFL